MTNALPVLLEQRGEPGDSSAEQEQGQKAAATRSRDGAAKGRLRTPEKPKLRAETV